MCHASNHFFPNCFHQKDKMKKYQPKAEDKVVVKNKRYIEPEEKPDHQQHGVRPLHAWAEQEHQAHRQKFVNSFFNIFILLFLLLYH